MKRVVLFSLLLGCQDVSTSATADAGVCGSCVIPADITTALCIGNVLHTHQITYYNLGVAKRGDCVVVGLRHVAEVLAYQCCPGGADAGLVAYTPELP